MMTHEEIQKQVLNVNEWSRKEARRLLQEHNEKKNEKLAPLKEACSKLGHVATLSGVRNILGDEFLVCKWCGASMGLTEE